MLPLWCVLGLSGAVAALAADKSLDQCVHHAWTHDDGLPQNSVTALTETRDGYLWVGTQEGLARFDGVRFVAFTSRNTDALGTSLITALLEDRHGTLWIGTSAGLVRYAKREFTAVAAVPSAVAALWEDERGDLFVAGDEVYVAAHGGSDFTPLGPDTASVQDLTRTPDGTLWMGGGRLVAWDEATGRPLSELASAPVSVLAHDGDTLWVGTRGQGLFARRDGALQRVPLDEAAEHVHAMAVESGSLWVGTLGAGLVRVVADRVSSFRGEDGLGNNDVLSVYAGRHGSLWVGTNGSGLHQFVDGAMTTYSRRQGLGTPAVWSVQPAPDGTVWVGTQGAGLFALRGGVLEDMSAATHTASTVVTALLLDSHDALWLGTDRRGVGRVQHGRTTFHAEKEGFEGGVTMGLAEDSAGRTWAATPFGLFVRAGETWRRALAELADAPSLATVIAARGGGVWAGGTLLARVEPQGTRVFGHAEGLRASLIVALFEEEDGTLWIGTADTGLWWRTADGVFHHCGAREGLPSDIVFSITPDSDGQLWMSSNAGVFAVRRDELWALAQGRVAAVGARLFDKLDGLQAGECNGGGGSAAARGPDGALWLATPDGVARLDPARSRSTARPRVMIEDISCDGHAVPLDTGAPAALTGTVQQCEIHFTAIQFAAAPRLRFRYRLVGMHDAWVEGGNRRAAWYTNLPPGNFRFDVTAYDARAPDDTAVSTSVAFRVLPRFHQTWWFALVLALLALGVVAAGWRWRVRALQQRQLLLEATVAERTRDLRAARDQLQNWNANLEQRVEEGISRLREAEHLAAYGRLVAGVAHEVRHPVFALETTTYVLSEKAAQHEDCAPEIGLIRAETRRLSRLMEDLLQFARPPTLVHTRVPVRPLLEAARESYAAGHGQPLPVTLAVADDTPHLWADHDRVVQLLVNLLDNAHKHAAGATQLTLKAWRSGPDGGVTLEARDNGGGIAPEVLPRVFEPFFTTGKGSGLGLSIARRVVTDHQGTISVESSAGGTVFRMGFPPERSGAATATVG